MKSLLLFSTFNEHYWIYLIVFAALSVLSIALFRFLAKGRKDVEGELKKLLSQNPKEYLNRLENNKRLKMLFPKVVLNLFLLDGYMITGREDKVEQIISQMDGKKLDPGILVEYLQKRLSYYIGKGNDEEAVASRDRLVGFLKKVKAEKVDKYKEIMEEADAIVRVYVLKDVSFIDSLVAKASRSGHPVVRGVTQFRIAKLSHFNGNKVMTEKYLRRAQVNLKGTYYQEIIEGALKDNGVLDTK